MTFNDVALKNFKGNMRRYMAYFLCNSFSIMMFFMYSTLAFNDKLNNSPQVEKGVIAGVVIPNVALVVFSLFFISYSHAAFIKARKKEFGLFINLGMSIEDIRKIILLENGLVALASIILGVLSGAIFSRIFFLGITRAMSLKGIPFSIGLKNFAFSIGIFSVIFTLAIIVTMLIVSRLELSKLLKEDRVSETNKISSPFLALIGIALLAASLVFLYKRFLSDNDIDKNSRILLFCTIGCVVGLYVTISQLGSSLINIAKKRPGVYFNNLLLITSLNHKFKQTKRIVFAITMMVMVSIFYSSVCLNSFLSADRIASKYNPYDVAFVQTQNNNTSLDNLNSMVNSSENPIINHKSMEFTQLSGKSQHDSQVVVISDNELREAANKNIYVPKGRYIRLVQDDSLTSNDKKKYGENDLTFTLGNKYFKYSYRDNVFQVMFNSLHYFGSNEFYILNSDDYKELKGSINIETVGTIQLIDFKDWKQTKTIVNKLNDLVKSHNKKASAITHPGEEQPDFQVASKVEVYNYNKQGSSLVFYLVSFIGIFFFIAACVILFLRLFSEIENDKKNYKRLYKLGMSEEEIRKSISKELRIIFFMAPVIGIAIALVYYSAFSKDSNAILDVLECDFIMSGIYLLFQILYYYVAKRIYGNEIIESL
ncbi:MAG: ABC transporter permease [Bacillota bacterium]|nr:ABC transporter permease [Bacillota bacterium]